MHLAGNFPGRRKSDQQNLINNKSRLLDAESRAPLYLQLFAVKESNVAIVTNIDGEFTLKIGDLMTSKNS